MKKKFLKNKYLRKIKMKERQNKSIKSFEKNFIDDLNLHINIDDIDLKNIKTQEYDGELILQKMNEIIKNIEED